MLDLPPANYAIIVAEHREIRGSATGTGDSKNDAKNNAVNNARDQLPSGAKFFQVRTEHYSGEKKHYTCTITFSYEEK